MVSRAYWWIFIIGLMIIMFLWSAIVTGQGIEHYQIISDYSLFRPLGWTPPDTTPRFILLGTIVGENFARAYFTNIRNNNIIIVNSGDWLGNQQIEKITSNNVTIKGGEKNYVSSRIQFLTGISRKTRRKISRKNTAAHQQSNDSGEATGNSQRREPRTMGTSSRRGGGRNRQQWQEAITRFQSAGPEDRQKMIEEFRSRRGGGQRRN